ncbi:ribulose-phosphate 3-epimerase [bacterium]|jgi:ribulose-phosphate 3-epimerase|nr:ribulose-phosphate 3-epimerase [bacterium]
MSKIFPSLISGDLLNLKKQIDELAPHCDGYHIDIMDDHFVPNLTWGPMFVNAISKSTQKPLFVHLMVNNPEVWPSRLQINSSSTLCFHIESAANPVQLIKQIIEKNIVPAIAIRPKTPLEEIYPFLAIVDQVLLMSVEPGSSGKTFLSSTIDRLNELVLYKKDNNLSFSICMDGGIGKENIRMLKNLGVEQFGIASEIFNHADPVVALENLYRELKI